MKPYFEGGFPARHASQLAGVAGWGNAGSLHCFGQKAMKALDESREKIAGSIGADFREIIFTGSATEANNLALRGVVKAAKIKNPRIIISAIEHESVLETARDLEKDGVEVVCLPVDKSGLVNLKKLKESLNDRTILVSVMYANNEIGTIQPISAIAEIIKKFRIQNAELKKNNSKFLILNSELTTALPLFHSDAVQAFQFLSCDVNELGVDLMTLSAHKIYGPKGVGLLYRRIKNKKNESISPILTGGGQEYGLRSGTENIPLIIGFAKAVELAAKNREKEAKRISALRNYFLKGFQKINSKIKSNVLIKNNLPNILNVCFPNKSAEDLLVKLDLAGVAVSAGSACSARSLELSYVLKACGLPLNVIKSSLRISLGKFTTKEEIKEVLRRIKAILS
jgi:cysteine desulfurase